MEPVHLHERPAMFYSLGLLLLGGQLMSIGFLAELFIAYHAPETRGYSISERTTPPVAHGSRPIGQDTASPTPMTDPAAELPRARLRWSVYLLLIFLGAGAMLGRILAVDSVDKAGLEKYRLKKIAADLAQKRHTLESQGLAAKP